MYSSSLALTESLYGSLVLPGILAELEACLDYKENRFLRTFLAAQEIHTHSITHTHTHTHTHIHTHTNTDVFSSLLSWVWMLSAWHLASCTILSVCTTPRLKARWRNSCHPALCRCERHVCKHSNFHMCSCVSVCMCVCVCMCVQSKVLCRQGTQTHFTPLL